MSLICLRDLMSKVNSKFFVSAYLVVLIVFFVFLPQDLSALEGISKRQNLERMSARESICSRMDAIYENIENRARDREQKIFEISQEKKSRIEERRNLITQNLESRRFEWDENRKERYAKLMERAQTDAQKIAVVNFQKAIEEAVAQRRNAINKATEEFRGSMDSALSDRKNLIDKAVETYQKDRKEAFEKAKASCDAGRSSSEVRAQLHSDLESALKKFRSSRMSAEKLNEKVKLLSETKRQAVKKAIEDFRNTLNLEISKLRSVFPED